MKEDSKRRRLLYSIRHKAHPSLFQNKQPLTACTISHVSAIRSRGSSKIRPLTHDLPAFDFVPVIQYQWLVFYPRVLNPCSTWTLQALEPPLVTRQHSPNNIFFLSLNSLTRHSLSKPSFFFRSSSLSLFFIFKLRNFLTSQALSFAAFLKKQKKHEY